MQRYRNRVNYRIKLAARLPALSVSAAVGLSLLFTPLVSAQDNRVSIEEIIVTARKREESLQTVPLAITTFSTGDIEERGMNDARDLSQAVAGLQIESDFGRTNDRPSIRGMSNIRPETDQPVAGFVDGVFLSGNALISSMMDTVEQIEVVKGPQSALYGRSTFAGAINFITKRPTEEFEAQARITIAEHGERDLSLNLSGPITDNIGFVLGLRDYSFDGDYDIAPTPEYNRLLAAGADLDTDLNGKAGEESSQNIFAKLMFTPTEDLEINLSYMREDIDDGAPRVILSDLGANNFTTDSGIPGFFFDGDVPNPGVVSAAASQFDDLGGIGIRRESDRFNGILDWQINDGLAVKYIGSYYEEDQIFALDQSYTGIETIFGGFVAWGTYDETSFESVSHEIRLQSTNEGPVNWLIGAYYYDDKEVNNDLQPSDPFDTVLMFDSRADSDTTAIFGSLEYEFTEKLTGTVEVRDFEETVEQEGAAVSRKSVTFEDTTARFTLDYQLNDNVLLYGLFSDGFKRGGFNINVADPTLLNFRPETIENYEIGAKLQWPDAGVTLNLAAFRIDWTDQQLSLTAMNNEGDLITVVANVGDSEIDGFEAELSWQPNENWELGAAIALASPEFTRGCERVQSDFFGGSCPIPGFEGGDITGFKPPRISEREYNLSVAYDSGAIFGDFSLFARADAAFASTRYSQVHNLAGTGDSTKVNLRGGIANDKLTLTLFVDNATDEDAPTNIFRYVNVQSFFPRNTVAFLPAKRQVGVTLDYKF